MITPRRGEQTADTPFEFFVIGEHRSNAGMLLTVGSDGLTYSLDLRTGHVAAVEPDGEWILEQRPEDQLFGNDEWFAYD